MDDCYELSFLIVLTVYRMHITQNDLRSQSRTKGTNTCLYIVIILRSKRTFRSTLSNIDLRTETDMAYRSVYIVLEYTGIK